jgi:hypothetical protein
MRLLCKTWSPSIHYNTETLTIVLNRWPRRRWPCGRLNRYSEIWSQLIGKRQARTFEIALVNVKC